MELTERLPLEKIAYLSKMSFDEYKPHSAVRVKGDAQKKVQYNILMAFCRANLKAKGEIRRIYSHTLNEVGGRLYCGNSIQGLPRNIRGFLCRDIMTDIDFKNCHPTIVRYLCNKNKIDCPNLSHFIANRDEIYSRFPEGVGKQLFLKALNDDKLNKKVQDSVFQLFDKEMKNIQSKIIALPEYKYIVDTVPADKTFNWNGSAFNRIMCVYENKILQVAISVINQHNIEIAVLMFDGLMLYGDHYNNTELLLDIENTVNNQLPNLKMVLTTKPHADSLVIPANISSYDADKQNDDCYEAVKTNFEKKHAKLVNKALFITELDDGDLILHTATKFRTSFEDVWFMDYNANTPTRKQFIVRWFLDDNKRHYADLGVYPPPLQVPATMYNLWQPFKISKYTEDYEKDENALQMFIKHIEILCNHDTTVSDYVIKWFAQMFQYPAVKTIVLTFISDEGAGKGTLLDVISAMMGVSKIFVSTQPSRDVWGNFNSLMDHSFFVNLNEMCKKETQEAEGRIKGLITDSSLMINKKGIDTYPITSYHRFIITTNKEDPITTKKGDRRNIVIRASDELMGNIDYFTNIRKALLNPIALRTIYDYLMDIPDMDKFGSIPRPTTEYQEDMKDASRSYYDRWIEQYTRDHQESTKDYIDLHGQEQSELFSKWCHMNKIQYDVSSIKMGLAIKRLKIPGIEMGIHTMKGSKTRYHIKTLMKHYKVGLLL